MLERCPLQPTIPIYGWVMLTRASCHVHIDSSNHTNTQTQNQTYVSNVCIGALVIPLTAMIDAIE